jgi:hypothetical protein
MGFEQDPDYEYLKALFKQIMNSNGLSNDDDFDWITKLQPSSPNNVIIS